MASSPSDNLSLPAIILEGSSFLPHNTLKLQLSESTTSRLLETWTNPDQALMTRLTGKWLVFFTALPTETIKVNLEAAVLTLNSKSIRICATGCIGEIVSIQPTGSSADQKLLVLVKGLSRCTYVKEVVDSSENASAAPPMTDKVQRNNIPSLPYVKVKPHDVSMHFSQGNSAELDNMIQKFKTHAIALFMLFPILRSIDAVKALQGMSNSPSSSVLADILMQSLQEQRLVNVLDGLTVLAARTLYDQLVHTLGIMEKVLPLVSTVAKLAGNRNKAQGEMKGKVSGKSLKGVMTDGEDDEDEDDIQEIRKKLIRNQSFIPDHVKETITKELKKIMRIPSTSPDYHITLTYLHTLADFPWGPRAARGGKELALPGVGETGASILQRAKRILDEEHFGLHEVKERILQFLAVKILRGNVGKQSVNKEGGLVGGDRGKGMILCLVGPPGVGKTSLAKSIARCLGLGYSKLSLGGVYDPAELRGHRRTYIGAMMGSVAQGVIRGGGTDVVLVLDEVDKVGWRAGRGGGVGGGGDVQGVLLEVLDPDQNASFTDHYLAVPLDLSPALFIATANSLDTLSPPLLDRMEIVQMGGYGVGEKVGIGIRYLIPRQIEGAGLKKVGNGAAAGLDFAPGAVREIVVGYTREAGVRQLEREIGSICRHVAKQHVQTMSTSAPVTTITITPEKVHSILGAPRYASEVAPLQTHPQPPISGVVMGLAYTPQGGELLYIEAVCITAPRTGDGSRVLGQVSVTGNVGKIMEESCQLCLDWLRANCAKIPALVGGMKLPVNEFHDRLFYSHLRVHLPGGAVAKDGPSAGAALLLAILSSLCETPVSATLCLTGEVTLRGAVMAVGGIKEKVMAAVRGNLRKVILPVGNRRDFEKIQQDIHDDSPLHSPTLTVIFVESIEQLIHNVFGIHNHPHTQAHPHSSSLATTDLHTPKNSPSLPQKLSADFAAGDGESTGMGMRIDPHRLLMSRL